MLTYIQINAAKPREKAWSLSDSQGLLLLVQPNGSKLWRFRYRFDEHLALLMPDGFPERGALLDLFDYWRAPSERLRQYLWAHRDADVDRARQLIEILDADAILVILRYLIEDYWGRYLGWPDLLLWRHDQVMLVEVKSSSDRLSAEQMQWIADNHDILKLPFRVAKLHRTRSAG